MFPLAVFGIESSGLNLAIDLIIVFLVVLYLALAYWTYADAQRRIVDPMLVGCATAAALLFPFVGAIVYLIVRPPEYLEDVRERELEMEAAEARMRELEGSLCPYCDTRIEPDFVRCPSCLRRLKERCTSCARPLEPTWTICPYCEADVPPSTASRRTRRARSARSAQRGEFGAPATAGGRLLDDEEQVDLAALDAGGRSEVAQQESDDPLRAGAADEAEPIVRPASASARGRPSPRPRARPES
jgi:Double zinc ribbon